jgi:hypothetical protein
LIRHRPMRHRDISECVRLVATHPILGPRYGGTIKDLPGVWRRLLSNEWFFTAALFEETQGSQAKTLGAGIDVVVTEEFFQEAKTPPYFWLGPELTRRIAQGRSPLLTEKQVAEANSRKGLNIVIWQSGVHPDDLKRPEIWEVGVNAFIKTHQGFRLNEWILQAESREHFVGILNVGSILYGRSDSDDPGPRQLDPGRAAVEPHLTGLPRETALRQVGSWTSTVFRYQPPILFFSRSEQRLLWAALEGETDERLSDSLGVSLSAIKKTWRAIYLRVADHMPELIPSQSPDEGSTQDRGKEKKRRVVAYLRDHPEELRPYERRLVQEDGLNSRRIVGSRSKSRPPNRGLA